MMATITSFFSKADGPLPITWKKAVEPPKKRAKRGPGRPRRAQSPAVVVTSDDEQHELEEEAEDGDCQLAINAAKLTTRRVYTVDQKKKIVVYAKENSLAGAQEHFDVPRTTISRWMVDGYFQRNTTKKGVKRGAGRPISYGDAVDNQLIVWLLEARDKQLPVTIPLLKARALELITPTHTEFHASDGWAQKFKRRHSLALRIKTSLAQELPATLEERISAFHTQLQRLKEINRFEVIGNMDETPLYFDVVPSRILDRRGKKSIIVRTTGSEKRHLTVVMCVTHDGDVLPALTIFKGKRPLQIRADGVYIRTQEKAWMDEPMMLQWIDLVWEPATERKRALLILDSFSAHVTNSVKKRLKEINTVPLVIPGGCTSKIQPLDVSLNKPFKAFVRTHWSEYIIGQSESVVSTQKLKPPQKADVADWISDALRQLQEKPDMISRSFAACGITGGSQVRPHSLLEGQEYPDSEDEADNPYLDEELDSLVTDY